jgi:AcrR family transcriptional regulator
MPTKGRAPSEGAAPNGLRASRNGHGPVRVAEIQHARILAAMVEVCVEHGPANVRVAHVVERAGVSRRTFYEIFDDRDACFLVALEEGIARVSRCVLDTYDPDAKWAERIRMALTALLEFLDVERGIGWLLIVGSLGAGSDALECRRRVLAQMITVIDEGRKETRAGKEPPPLTAEGVVGGVLSVLHSRLLDREDESPLVELTGPLMGMIVLPYLGMAAVPRELKRPTPAYRGRSRPGPADPLRDVAMRLTYRTMRVLTSVAADPGSSNREIGLASGVGDQGQISKLLTRLTKLGLIENSSDGQARGAPNAWVLTPKGQEIEQAVRANKDQ